MKLSHCQTPYWIDRPGKEASLFCLKLTELDSSGVTIVFVIDRNTPGSACVCVFIHHREDQK